MSKNIPIDEKKIERFAIGYLKDKGYLVHRVFKEYSGEDEASVIKYFYSKARIKSPGSLSDVFHPNFEIDIAILRKAIFRISDYGLSFHGSLKFFIKLIDYLFENPSSCGGPYTSFKIFSSEGFLDNLLREYDRHKFDFDESQWDKKHKEDSNFKVTDYTLVRDELTKLKGKLNG